MNKALRPTNNTDLWVVKNGDQRIMAFGSGGRTSYLTPRAAFKALNSAITISNSTEGTDFTHSEFSIVRLDR